MPFSQSVSPLDASKSALGCVPFKAPHTFQAGRQYALWGVYLRALGPPWASSQSWILAGCMACNNQDWLVACDNQDRLVAWHVTTKTGWLQVTTNPVTCQT